MTVTIAARWQFTVQVRAMSRVVRTHPPASRRMHFPSISNEELATRQAMRQVLASERLDWDQILMPLTMGSNL